MEEPYLPVEKCAIVIFGYEKNTKIKIGMQR